MRNSRGSRSLVDRCCWVVCIIVCSTAESFMRPVPNFESCERNCSPGPTEGEVNALLPTSWVTAARYLPSFRMNRLWIVNSTLVARNKSPDTHMLSFAMIPSHVVMSTRTASNDPQFELMVANFASFVSFC
jgi:hypothetical protein